MIAMNEIRLVGVLLIWSAVMLGLVATCIIAFVDMLRHEDVCWSAWRVAMTPLVLLIVIGLVIVVLG